MTRFTGDPSGPHDILTDPAAEKYLGLPKGRLAQLDREALGPERYLHKAGGFLLYERAWLDAWRNKQSLTPRSVPAPVVSAPVPVATVATMPVPVILAPSPPPAPPPAPKVDPDDPAKPLEARIKGCWDASADLRAEFSGQFERYAAYRKAEAAGLVRGSQPQAYAPAPAISEPSGSSIEDRCRAEWRRDPALRAEFGEVFDHFLAYAEAEAAGLVRIHNPGRGGS